MDDELHAMLVALGPGGTRELAERALAFSNERLATESLFTVTKMAVELGGTQEVCALLGVGKAWLGHVIAGRRPTPPVLAPEPLVTLAATPVWDLADWREWATVNATLLPQATTPVDSRGEDPFA
jgi:hypothetical protein